MSVEAILELHRSGLSREALFAAFNRTYAIVRYGNEMVIASIVADDIFFMKIQDFHRMFGNVLVMQGVQANSGDPTLAQMARQAPLFRPRRSLRARRFT